jgi:ATP-dependent helicase/nuclease subunit A
VTPSALHRPVTSGEHGTEWGTVIHFLLQQAMVAPESDLQPLAFTALEEQGLSTSLVEETLATVRSVMDSAIWRRARAASRFLVEVPFTRLLEPGAEGATLPTILRGVIDLAFAEPEGWVIVDYKTDAVAPEHLGKLAEHYRPQVVTYAGQWERIVGQPVKERGLYFVRPGVYQPV